MAAAYPNRVVDWPPDETTLVGAGIGFAHAGLTPVVEIPYAAYLSCGYNQFAEAAFFHWLSEGKQTNGMVLRLQGFDEGVFGGHFHTANGPPIFGIPGLDVVCHSNGRDWARGFREALAIARRGGVVALLDSTNLLPLKHVEGRDLKWLTECVKRALLLLLVLLLDCWAAPLLLRSPRLRSRRRAARSEHCC